VTGAPLDIERILVPIDFSASSDESLEYARRLAARCGASLELVHVVNVSAGDGLLGPGDPTVWERAIDAARTRLGRMAADDGGVPHRSIVLEGRPPDIICDHAIAMQADLIVIGSLGRSGLQRLLLGSVAEQVARTSPCPVLIVRQGTSPPG
jgi:nucleotide-binding universal stress UspA family protein